MSKFNVFFYRAVACLSNWKPEALGRKLIATCDQILTAPYRMQCVKNKPKRQPSFGVAAMP
jgi:hypothetical protein